MVNIDKTLIKFEGSQSLVWRFPEFGGFARGQPQLNHRFKDVWHNKYGETLVDLCWPYFAMNLPIRQAGLSLFDEITIGCTCFLVKSEHFLMIGL